MATAADASAVEQVDLPPPTATGAVVERPAVGGGMEEDVVPWLEGMLGAELKGDLHAHLRSGVLLCAVANKLRPGIIPKPHAAPRMAFKQMENTGWFLEAAGELGVLNSDLFATTDLFEGSNMKQVLICLNALRLKVL